MKMFHVLRMGHLVDQMKGVGEEPYQHIGNTHVQHVRCERGLKFLVRVLPHDETNETVGDDCCDRKKW